MFAARKVHVWGISKLGKTCVLALQICRLLRAGHPVTANICNSRLAVQVSPLLSMPFAQSGDMMLFKQMHCSNLCPYLLEGRLSQLPIIYISYVYIFHTCKAKSSWQESFQALRLLSMRLHIAKAAGIRAGVNIIKRLRLCL